MIDITKKELLDKYGISLDKGEYTIENINGVYKINTVKDDTSGCILVGTEIVEDKLIHSITAFTKLFSLMQKAAQKETLQIDVFDINVPVAAPVLPEEIVIPEPIVIDDSANHTITIEQIPPITTELQAQQTQVSWKNNFWLNFFKQIWVLFKKK